MMGTANQKRFMQLVSWCVVPGNSIATQLVPTSYHLNLRKLPAVVLGRISISSQHHAAEWSSWGS